MTCNELIQVPAARAARGEPTSRASGWAGCFGREGTPGIYPDRQRSAGRDPRRPTWPGAPIPAPSKPPPRAIEIKGGVHVRSEGGCIIHPPSPSRRLNYPLPPLPLLSLSLPPPLPSSSPFPPPLPLYLRKRGASRQPAIETLRGKSHLVHGHHPPPCVGADRCAVRCDLRS